MIPTRTYEGDGVSVIFAANKEGRVDPFVFTDKHDAERAAERLKDLGQICTVVLYHGVEVLDGDDSIHFARGLLALKELFGE